MGISCFPAKGRTRLRAMVFALVVTVVAAGLMAGEPPSASAASGAAASGAAPITKPPMGWASWNSFAAQINYNVIKTQTDALERGVVHATRVKVTTQSRLPAFSTGSSRQV
ncbi:hypothetical protein [Actinoallomurus sp. NPDC050550]|uniref:hypothetical protein n=1 Tax=Actinoallomurus sp. NPDC050550 TaxID=3154937 RepID=UPI00340AABBE